MSQSLLKIEHSEIENACYGYQTSRPKYLWQGETKFRAQGMSLRCGIGNLPLFEPIIVTQHQSEHRDILIYTVT